MKNIVKCAIEVIELMFDDKKKGNEKINLEVVSRFSLIYDIKKEKASLFKKKHDSKRFNSKSLQGDKTE